LRARAEILLHATSTKGEDRLNRKLRTAIATLIAALSVAVMIDAAPANASIGSMSASLSISPAGGGLRNVVVSGVVRTSSYSEALQLYNSGHRVVYRLWGDDPIWDNLLFGPASVFQYEARSDGLYFYNLIQLNSSYLNEDRSWTDNYDEVYAGVRLVNLSGSTIRSAETNRACGYF
jgi:hypothetical protein